MGFYALPDRKAFIKDVMNADPEELEVLYFWMTTCGPCKAINGDIEKMTEQYKDKAKFYKVDLNEVEDVAQECGVRMTPTFVLFKDGMKVDDMSGPKIDKLRQMIEENL